MSAAGAFMLSASGTGCGGATATPGAQSAEDAVGGEATCGGETSPEGELSWEERQLLADYEEQMSGYEGDLTPAMQLSGGPDCATAARLKDNICDLAQRICEIRDRYPDNDDVAQKCEDGEQRCDRATNDVTDACSGAN